MYIECNIIRDKVFKFTNLWMLIIGNTWSCGESGTRCFGEFTQNVSWGIGRQIIILDIT